MHRYLKVWYSSYDSFQYILSRLSFIILTILIQKGMEIGVEKTG
ncbi:Uncharacterized protein dnl_05360 [Desulfonema limicola]|uniref:Uncharacterized protein n=1 Tax=Desulfonema limicola TaxID=45656 RepID=A0A975GEN4_9BACT|nr:Uncharacterized protein dnl_05360 [Desulfonema limicola]